MSEPLPIASLKSAELKDFISLHLNKYCESNNHEISILCLGTLFIDDYLANWLKDVAEENKYSVKLHIVKDKHIANRVSDTSYFPQPKLIHNCATDKIQITHDQDHFSLDSELPFNGEKFDVIISLYLIHNAINWRLLLTRLFSTLKNGGYFIFPEAGGSYSILDGNFKGVTPELIQPLKDFDDCRNEKYHFWRPELSLSNYSVLKNQLEPLFDEIIDHESTESEYDEEWKKGTINVDINSGYTFKRIILDKIFSYFHTGLPDFPKKEKDERKRTILYNDITKVGLNIEIKELDRKDQIYLCKEFNEKRYKTIKERHWNYTKLLKDIDHIKDNQINTLGRKAMDILISHDVFFPGFTQFIALISWESKLSENWSDKIHLVADNSSRFDTISQSLPLCREPELQFLKRLFKESSSKYPIYIQLVEDKELDDLEKKKNYTVINMDGKKIAYYIERTRKNGIEEIKLAITDKIRDTILAENPSFDVDVLGDFKDTIEEERKLKADVLVKCEVKKNNDELPDRLTLNDNTKLKCYEINTDEIKIKTEKAFFVEISRIIENAFWGITDKEKRIRERTPLEWLITFTVLLWLKETGYRLGYIPSSIINEKNSNDKETVNGLGGVILLERTTSDDTLNGLFDARDKALEEAVNLIFYKSSIANSHVKQDFYKHALLSAGAAISTRSGSHTLGSHVLPGVIGSLSKLIYEQMGFYDNPFPALSSYVLNPTHKQDMAKPNHLISRISNQFKFLRKNNKNLANEKELFKYLQERLDFITQVVGDLPQWSLSLNYMDDLLKGFYQQFHMLNSLGDTEGIRAFFYPSREEILGKSNLPPDKEVYIEKNWFAGTDYKKLKAGDHIVVYGHCLPFRKKICVTGSKIDPAGVVNPAPPLFICNDYLPEYEGNYYEISMKGIKKIFGQKIKIAGIVKDVNADEIELEKCRIYQNKLVIKARLRKYFKLENNRIIGISPNSLILSDVETNKRNPEVKKPEENFLDIGKRAENKQLKDEEQRKKYIYFYCVIKSIDKASDDTGYIITFFSPENIFMEIKKDDYDAITRSVDSISDKVRDMRIRTAIFCIGARLIIKGKIIEINGNYKITGDAEGMLPLIEEISVIDYLTTTSVTKEDTTRQYNDMQIAIPGGTVGTQAFYIILENIIRNAAKHNWIHLDDFYKLGKNLELKIELEDINNPDYFICKIWTNTTNLEFKNGIPFKEELEGGIFTDDKHGLKQRINDNLIHNIIDENGLLRRENLGLSEIKICAAFLAKYDWMENGLAGTRVLLNDKGYGAPGGFIRCSMILEEDAGKLVPRLGFRIKMLKLQEVAIIGKDCEAGSKKHQGVSCIIDSSILNRDYQLCVFYDNDSNDSNNRFDGKLIKLVKRIEKNKEYDTERDLRELSREIENYPCRLLIVTDNIKTSLLKEPPLLFFRKRIFLMSTKEFNTEWEKPGDLRTFLYKKWYSLFVSKEHNFKLQVDPKGGFNSFLSSIQQNITVPPNLQTATDNPPPLIDEYLWEPQEGRNTYLVKYSRHSNRKVDDEVNKIYTIYSEGISGASRISTLLKNYSGNEELIKAKLAENGLCNVMIVDERVFNYVYDKKSNEYSGTLKDQNLFNIFQHQNIIVFYELTINENIIYKAPLLQELKQGATKEICLKNKDKIAVIRFIQPYNISKPGHEKDPKDYMINSFVIHQTILDHLSRGLFQQSDPDLVSQQSSDDVIYKLKHELGIPCVIITSGRGRSPNSSKYARFIPFSNISHLLLRRDPDKFTLTQILLQSLNLSGDGN